MKRVIVRYRVKPERVAENEELVRGVYAELDAAAPDGLRYGTFRLEDGVSFVHIAEHADDNPLRGVAATCGCAPCGVGRPRGRGDRDRGARRPRS